MKTKDHSPMKISLSMPRLAFPQAKIGFATSQNLLSPKSGLGFPRARIGFPLSQNLFFQAKVCFFLSMDLLSHKHRTNEKQNTGPKKNKTQNQCQPRTRANENHPKPMKHSLSQWKPRTTTNENQPKPMKPSLSQWKPTTRANETQLKPTKTNDTLRA